MEMQVWKGWFWSGEENSYPERLSWEQICFIHADDAEGDVALPLGHKPAPKVVAKCLTSVESS